MTQVHINIAAPQPEMIEQITFRQGFHDFWQPGGGLWTFPHDPNSRGFRFWTAEYSNLHSYAGPGSRFYSKIGKPPFAWLIYPSASARVACVNSKADLLELGRKYGWLEQQYFRPIPFLGIAKACEPACSLNFPEMAKDFDGFQITERGIDEVEAKELGKYRQAFWEAECTCWFRWKFDRVDKGGFLSEFEAEHHGTIFDVLAARQRSYAAAEG